MQLGYTVKPYEYLTASAGFGGKWTAGDEVRTLSAASP